MSKPPLPSLNAKIPSLPSFSQSVQVPPPIDDAPDDETNNTFQEDDNNTLEDDDDEDTIKTEEGFEEAAFPDELLKGTATDAPQKSTETRSLKVLKQIIEPFLDQNGVSTFDEEMDAVEKKKQLKLLDPTFKKAYLDNADIFFEGKQVASVMESIDDTLVVPKDTQHVMSAVCKVFLAELVSETQRVREDDKGGAGPLLPEEVNAAYRRMRDRGDVPDIHRKPFFMN
ncbi:hypothetical protein EIN_409830 [Entamoeba invadens IP1]|uniref:TAFII28-like protein domain-containing protein n=1 Tax=Entamoeba invadens IP1 TaxID=370355 RepID=A0A0A1TWP9_ENTIV|nr:hypothetical protein EIN_409830 [Entamoeba invadens IP1]ELP85664.1 hypothetical protein EIN_409830 [Entamoeba invadens IP1]|eukprot:XP_004185010.1 hypothetical protein EIN_409830 [Entamoeba invadens IP1]